MFNRPLSIALAAPAALLTLFCLDNLRAAPPVASAPAARPALPETFLAQERLVGVEEIKIGMCNAQTGRIAGLGSGAKLGIEALFAQVNAAGGVHGRKLKLVAYDDRYEPLDSVVGTYKLINDDKVFALCTSVGTPTTAAVLPLLTEANMPLVGAVSGAESLRAPANPLVFNVRAGYLKETQALVEHLVADCGAKRVAVFIQRDGYGDAVANGVQRALRQQGLDIVARGSYVRNSTEIDAALEALIAAKPDAVVMGGSYPACAAFVRAAKGRKFSPFVCSVSFVGTESFIEAAGAAADGVFISQVLPDPQDAANPSVAEYQKAMRALGQNQFTYASLEGFINAMVLLEGLRATGANPTVGEFLKAMEKLQLDLAGQPCAFGPGNRQGFHDIFLTKVVGGQARTITKFADNPGAVAATSQK